MLVQNQIFDIYAKNDLALNGQKWLISLKTKQKKKKILKAVPHKLKHPCLMNWAYWPQRV